MRLENTWVSEVVPGQGLAEVFGCLQRQRLGSYVRSDADPLSSFRLDPKGESYPAYRVISTLAPGRAEVIGQWLDGSPAVTINGYGQGKAVLMGMYTGLNYERTKSTDDKMLGLLGAIIGRTGLDLRQPFVISGNQGFVGLRTLHREEEMLLFLLNYGGLRERCRITAPILESPRLILPKDGQLNLDEGGRPVVEVEPKSVVCIHAAGGGRCT